MKLMVATKLTQKQEANDYSFVPDGEIVTFGSGPCCNAEKCGCNRGMIGTSCNTGTTTMLIEDVEITEEELIGVLMDNFVSAGWAKFITPEEADKRIAEDAAELMRLGAYFPIGCIVTQKNGNFKVRRPKSTN